MLFRSRERDRESLNNVYQTKLQTLRSNLCCIAAIYGIFLAYFLIFYPLHHLLFQSDLPPPETTVQVLIENHTFAISPPPPPPLPPPYALVNDYCSQSSDPEPKICLATLKKILSAKYAKDLTQLTRIVADQSFNSTLAARRKFIQYMAVHHGEPEFNLRGCVEKLDNIVNYLDADFVGHSIGSPDDDTSIYGTLKHFWRSSIDHILDCTLDYDIYTPQEEKRTERYKVLKEFVTSITGEIHNLLHLGSSFSINAGISSMKLTELKPMPMVVALYKPDKKRLIQTWGLWLRRQLQPRPTRCGVHCFFSWLKSVL